MIHSLSLISIPSYFIPIKPPLDGIHGKVETKQSDGKYTFIMMHLSLLYTKGKTVGLFSCHIFTEQFKIIYSFQST